MEKIPSFTIDHEKLLRGIYVSRKDKTTSGDVITTFDIRLTEPNRMDPISPEAMHTIEHLGATFLRNYPNWKEKMIYWGPMGCCTGFYLILAGDLKSEDILPLMRETFQFISEFNGEIPGATPKDCGNWRFNNLAEAKKGALTYFNEILEHASAENLNYPS